MTADTELLHTVQRQFNDRFYSDPVIRSLYRTVADGGATYVEVQTFAGRTSAICSEVLNMYIPGSETTERIHDWAQNLVTPALTQMHDLVDDVAQQVQRGINNRAKIGIRPQAVPLDTERISGIAAVLEETDDLGQACTVLTRATENYARHISDEAVRRNAAFQHKAGLRPRIRRTASAKCCPWCAALAGEYDYADVGATGEDVWRRHLDCRCTITFIEGSRVETVQNYRTRKKG